MDAKFNGDIANNFLQYIYVDKSFLFDILP